MLFIVKLALYSVQQGHQAFKTAWEHAKANLTAGRRMELTLEPETRSLAQNRVLFARLTDVSTQVEWYGRKLPPESWKHIFSSSLRKLDVVPNLDGTGFVALGLSTSKMNKGELEDLNQLIMAFGTGKEVKWSVASLCGEAE